MGVECGQVDSHILGSFGGPLFAAHGPVRVLVLQGLADQPHVQVESRQAWLTADAEHVAGTADLGPSNATAFSLQLIVLCAIANRSQAVSVSGTCGG